MPNTVQGSGDTADRKKKRQIPSEGLNSQGRKGGTGGDSGGQM